MAATWLHVRQKMARLGMKGWNDGAGMTPADHLNSLAAIEREIKARQSSVTPKRRRVRRRK